MDKTNHQTMCDSHIKVVEFDKIPDEYARGKGWRGVPKSNDALYIDTKDEWFFVEFKNGAVKKDEIYRKMYDSLIMLVELEIIPNFDFARNNINYILVYNEGKKLPCIESESRNLIYDHHEKLAKKEKNYLMLINLKSIYFMKLIHTQRCYSKKNLLIQKKKKSV